MTDKQRFLMAREDFQYIERTYGVCDDLAEAHEGAFQLIFGRGGVEFSFPSATRLVVHYIDRMFKQGVHKDRALRKAVMLPVDADARLQQIKKRLGLPAMEVEKR